MQKDVIIPEEEIEVLTYKKISQDPHLSYSDAQEMAEDELCTIYKKSRSEGSKIA